MHKNIIYIIGMAVALAACSSEDSITGDGTLSGNGKTPLPIHATLSTGSSVTRAAGETFVEGDELLTYIRHVTGGTKGSYTTTTADQAPQLVTLTKGSAGMTVKDGAPDETTDLTATYTNTSSTTTTGLYWDDFSAGAKGDATDLRTDGHGLQSYYGYCYNGGTPSTTLTKETGVLGWTVETDQSTAAAVQHSDLLWSAEQEKVAYGHKDSRDDGTRSGLTIPYTHAMSEVTVTIKAGSTFAGSTPFTSTTLTLNQMNTVATLTAPTKAYSSTTPANITMFAEAYDTPLERKFTAIVAPGTKLKEGEKLLDINNADGNHYKVDISGTGTGEMLYDSKWADGHAVAEEGGKSYIQTKPGYNYHLDITIDKTVVTVRATLQDWQEVDATGTAKPDFAKDLTVTTAGHTFTNGSTFSLFRLAHSDASDEAAERENTAYEFATVPAYNNSTSKWENTPVIYWPDASTKYYFRALATHVSGTAQPWGIAKIGSIAPAEAPSFTITHSTGPDVLWGTTPAHNEIAGDPITYNYTKGAAIDPRTDDVPIEFIHAMSKVTFKLETDGTDGSDIQPTNAKVNLASANISISNLYVGSGTIKLEDGSIEPSGVKTADNAITGTATETDADDKPASTTTTIAELKVLPQTIGDESVITITLPNQSSAVYKLQLNKCVVTGGTTPITKWESNKNYVYTIRITKEEIQFRALVKDWENTEGSGDANLEWD